MNCASIYLPTGVIVRETSLEFTICGNFLNTGFDVVLPKLLRKAGRGEGGNRFAI